MSHNLFDHLRWKLLKGREVNGCINHMVCPDCAGERIGVEARQVTLAGYHIGQVSRLTLAELDRFIDGLVNGAQISDLGKNLCTEISHQVDILRKNGLGHLTLYRELPSLSGGELQRLFLSSHIDSRLDSLVYVLDEPTVGLHEIEKKNLLEQLRALKDQGNSILLVEHDPHMIAAADHIIDVGPLAGKAGGEIIYQGDYPGLLAAPRSLTGQYLSGQTRLPLRSKQLPGPDAPSLRLSNIWTNNLQGVEIDIPLNLMVGVAGVSGSGKSSLVMKTLVPLLDRYFSRRPGHSSADEDMDPEDEPTVFFSGRLEGAENLRGFSAVSQQPIGRHDNSNPASYLKIWDTVRKLFALSPQAKDKGLAPGDFSFNAGGACPTCSGNGKHRLWLGGSFFTTQPCPTCKGKRFREDVLAVRYHGKTILDILEMTASDACTFFEDEPSITQVLEVVVRSGMGYLPLGQPAPTLSGGEAQRIKLAYEISRAKKDNFLYILDEPTIGLSMYDTGRLLQLLDELVKKGNTILIIEHDPVVLSRCDWLIELGPGGGNAGGKIVAAGTPDRIREDRRSIIGPYLS